MSNVVNFNENLGPATTAFVNIFGQMYQGDAAQGELYKRYCFVDSKVCTNYQTPFVEGFTLPREWTGTRVAKQLLAQKINLPVKLYEATHQVGLVELDNDPNYVGASIRQWMGGQINFINSLVFTNVLSVADSVIGFDGVALASTAHPRVGGLSNQSNKTTSALSLTTAVAAISAMEGFTDSAGRPLGVKPKYIIVGPSNGFNARQIFEQKNIGRNTTNAGALDGSSNVVGISTVDNSIASTYGIEVIVEPLLVGTYANYWFLVGEQNGMSAPIVVNHAKAPFPTSDENLPYRNSPFVNLGITSETAMGPGIWQHIYAGIL